MHAPILASEDRSASAQTTWVSESACCSWATGLAVLLRPLLEQGGSFDMRLNGTLGAGKTTFTRHLLRALGVTGRVKSPSYAVVETHALPGYDVHHFDFYRFNDPQEWEDAGFRDLFAGPGLKLVEWPDKADGLLPTPDLSLHIEPLDDTQRAVQWRAHTAQGQRLLSALQPAEPEVTP